MTISVPVGRPDAPVEHVVSRVNPAAVLDYDALSETYRQGLVTRLRGFKAGDASTEAPGFLVSWVCHEDDVRSVEDLLDAAVEHGLREVTLRFGEATAARIGAAHLEETIKAFGATSRAPDAGAVLIRVVLHGEGRAVTTSAAAGETTRRARMQQGASTSSSTSTGVAGLSTHALYDAALARIATFPHQGDASASAITSSFATFFDQATRGTLGIDVDAQATTVTRACHHGSSGDARALLEIVCATIEGLPLREVADHGALRVELALRGRTGARPVAGVTTLGSADLRLAAAEALLRDLVRAWEHANHALPSTNEFVRAASASWREATLQERRARIDAVLDGLLPALGLAADALRFSAVEREVRVVLEARGARSPELPSVLFAVERALKEGVDVELSVYIEEMRDTNLLRRLTKPAKNEDRA